MTQNESPDALGYGLIGAGTFGVFCLEQYRKLESVRLIAVADARAESARAAAEGFGIAACRDVDELLSREEIDIVHIATPPFTHRDLVLRAVASGKHVLCEKPLALNLEDGREMIEAAKKAGRMLAVNLVMRYNPLCDIVRRIVWERLLGEPLHGFFENYAKDEHIPPGHWFWDRRKSGGIFIEHSVHFFDLFSWWLGKGRVDSAQQTVRPGTDIIEQVNCSAVYGPNVIVNFYHGFHQADRMDRQEIRLVFERGDLTLYEWVPTRMEIDAILDETTLGALGGLLPGCGIKTVSSYSGQERRCSGRHKLLQVDRRVRISYNPGIPKPDMYGRVLRGLMDDQVSAIRDPGHKRLVTEKDAFSSLEMAVGAARRHRHL